MEDKLAWIDDEITDRIMDLFEPEAVGNIEKKLGGDAFENIDWAKIDCPAAGKTSGASVFLPRAREGRAEDKNFTVPANNALDNIRRYFSECHNEYKKFLEKNKLPADKLTDYLLLSNPRVLFTFVRESVGIDRDRVKTDRAYREGVYANYIRCRRLLKQTLAQVDGEVKRAAEYSLAWLGKQASSMREYAQKDHPDWFKNLGKNK
jgi:hypothetical protein